MQRVHPGGVKMSLRSSVGIPLKFTTAKGSKVSDADANEYIDFS